MSRRQGIIGDIGSYTIASQVTQLISSISGILTRTLLGPFQMGIWATLQLVLTYSGFTTLGTTTACGREIPYYLGKKDVPSAAHVQDAVWSFGLGVSVVTGIGIGLFAFFIRARLSAPLFWGLISVAFFVILQRINNILITLLRAYKYFQLSSWQMVASAVVNLLLIVLFAYLFQFYGLLIAMLLSFVFNICFISYFHKFKFKFHFDRKLGDLIGFGFPLMLLGSINMLLKSVDKILIVKLLGFEAMGLYSVAVMVNEFLAKVPNSISVVLVPHFQEKYGERDSIKDVRRYVDEAAFGLLNLMPILLGLTWLATPAFIHYLLPAYQLSVPAVRFLILSAFFFSISIPYGDFLITVKRHRLIFPATGFSILMAIVLDVWAIRSGYGIGGVAMMTTMTQFVYFLFIFLFSARLLAYTVRERRELLVGIFVRFLIMLGAVWFVENVFSLHNVLLSLILQSFAFILIHLPLILSMNRRYHIFSQARAYLVRG